jgi:hypothetical protein
MFTSKGMKLRDMSQIVPSGGSADRGAVAEAREVNDGLRALFLPNMADAHGFELAGGEEGELK